MYIGGAQKRPDAPYARPVVNPSGKIVGQVSEGNRKDIREAVEAAHRAAPGYVTDWLWELCLSMVQLGMCKVCMLLTGYGSCVSLWFNWECVRYVCY